MALHVLQQNRGLIQPKRQPNSIEIKPSTSGSVIPLIQMRPRPPRRGQSRANRAALKRQNARLIRKARQGMNQNIERWNQNNRSGSQNKKPQEYTIPQPDFKVVIFQAQNTTISSSIQPPQTPAEAAFNAIPNFIAVLESMSLNPLVSSMQRQRAVYFAIDHLAMQLPLVSYQFYGAVNPELDYYKIEAISNDESLLANIVKGSLNYVIPLSEESKYFEFAQMREEKDKPYRENLLKQLERYREERNEADRL